VGVGAPVNLPPQQQVLGTSELGLVPGRAQGKFSASLLVGPGGRGGGRRLLGHGVRRCGRDRDEKVHVRTDEPWDRSSAHSRYIRYSRGHGFRLTSSGGVRSPVVVVLDHWERHWERQLKNDRGKEIGHRGPSELTRAPVQL
jgi:hypothetical protein